MLSWILRIVVVVALVWGGWYAIGRVESEKVCYDTNKCEDRLHSLEVNLEIYSSDKVIDREKSSGKPSQRRAFYPADLDELVQAQKGSAEFTTCPVYGVKYKYVQLEGGKSFFAWCPARHSFHFDGQPFVNAVTPEHVRLHLYKEGGKVYDLVGEHPNPWDFKSPVQVAADPSPFDAAAPTWSVREEPDISPDLFDMLAENPPAVSRW
jgi:hypothetical protein